MGSIAEITLADMVKVKRYISDIHGPQTAVALLIWRGREGRGHRPKKAPETRVVSIQRTGHEPRAFFFQKRERKMLPK